MPLLLMATAAKQRAAILALAVTVVFVFFVSLRPTWTKRSFATPTEVGLVAAGLLGVAVLVTTVSASDPDGINPIVEDFDEAFGGIGNEYSADARVVLYNEGIQNIKKRPILGSGLATQYEVKRQFSIETLESGAYHNIILDVWVRTGLIGLTAMLLAIALSLRRAQTAWLYHQATRWPRSP